MRFAPPFFLFTLERRGLFLDVLERRGGFFCAFFLCVKNDDKNEIKNKYYSLLVLYVCSWPGLEDHSSGPGSIVSRSLSRGESASLSSKHVGFFLAREKSSCVLFSRVCVCFCVGALFRFFFDKRGKTTVLKSSQKNRIILFFESKNRRHVQPSRVLRHGNRRATGRTHRNDGASSRKKNVFLSRRSSSSSFASLLPLFCRRRRREKSRSAFSRSLFFLLLRRFVYDIARARGVLCAGPTLRDHLHEYY